MSRPDLVLVAGASSDLGVALVRRLLQNGAASVLAHYHQGRERIEQLGAHDRIRPVCADFESIESVERMVDELGDQVPDQLVYLPALKLRYERFSKFNLGHFDKDMNVQVRSAIALCKRLLPKMAELPRAKVVFVLSSVTSRVPKFMSMYTVVKHAQLGLMRALASEYASSRITINAVSPTMIDTRFLDEVPAIAKEMTAAAAPRGRIASTGDVVGAIEFLLSPASDFISGIELPVTGGGGL
jgi:3-oxoacyl-[acyl-carrier protein] reductase